MIRIYVACLAAYNSAILHGSWIDATTGKDDIHDKISEMLKRSPERHAEEFAIHDYEGFGSYRLSEYENINRVAEIAEAIERHGEIFADFLSYRDFDDIGEAEQKFEESYQGCYRNLEDYAFEFLDSTGQLSEIPENLRNYFDFEKYARDLEYSGDIFTIEKSYNECHVFWNN